MFDGWPQGETPFHRGELRVQERLGVRREAESQGRRIIHDHLPNQHRAFYGELPFLVIGMVDKRGRPWASLVSGRPGFLTSPDAGTLEVGAVPLSGDPLREALEPGADVGVLGIQLETRRRNRISGRISAVRYDGFTIAVAQAFGNCPQYIQTRTVEPDSDGCRSGLDAAVTRSDRFDGPTRALVESSDTLFIATAYADDRGAVSQGADVSHRGGKPGFVRVDNDRTFTFPDYSGNNHFNTIGNILLNPNAGFLFVDFDAGDLIHMTGTVEIIWDGEEVRAFTGAERLLRFRAEEVIRIAGRLPFRFRFGEFSPVLDRTGPRSETGEAVTVGRGRDTYSPYEIVKIDQESHTVRSFYLRRTDGQALPRHEAGQFLPIRLRLPGESSLVIRTYTISNAPGGDVYRFSVKNEGDDGLASSFLHRYVRPGFRIEAQAPRGRFVLDRSVDRPVALVSAGIGMTPMVAMLEARAAESRQTHRFLPTYFIHGARNGPAFPFADHIRDLATEWRGLSTHIRFSQPDPVDRLGETHDSEGRVDMDLLEELLPQEDVEFYLCGPQSFMQALYEGLIDRGVESEHIHYESFGPATVRERNDGRRATDAESAHGPVTVLFAESGIEASWTPQKGTLLDLAESAGLKPENSCRSGICGTCATRIQRGTVTYLEEPVAPHRDDEVLICCSTPQSGKGWLGRARAPRVILRL